MHSRHCAMPWFEATSYAAITEMMDDQGRFPVDYDVWLTYARQVERELARTGYLVTRVIVEPEAFAAWCAENGLTPGRAARNRFADAMVGRAPRPPLEAPAGVRPTA